MDPSDQSSNFLPLIPQLRGEPMTQVVVFFLNLHHLSRNSYPLQMAPR